LTLHHTHHTACWQLKCIQTKTVLVYKCVLRQYVSEWTGVE